MDQHFAKTLRICGWNSTPETISPNRRREGRPQESKHHKCYKVGSIGSDTCGKRNENSKTNEIKALETCYIAWVLTFGMAIRPLAVDISATQ